jgi:hypothetical protein
MKILKNLKFYAPEPTALFVLITYIFAAALIGCQSKSKTAEAGAGEIHGQAADNS